MDKLLKESERKMKTSVDHLHQELAKVRTGRASVALVEDLKVDFYGTPTPLNQTSTLHTPDARTITIAPWDVSMLAAIEKAINASDLGLTPSNDGKVIRLNIPPMTTERREQMAKLVRKYAEDAKIAIRNVRRDFNDKLKAMAKAGEISKDEEKKGHDQIQKITDKWIEEVDKIAHAKEKDVMED